MIHFRHSYAFPERYPTQIRDHRPNYLDRIHHCKCLDGLSSHVLPISKRPFFFLFTPPHCLKKNLTSCALLCCSKSSTHVSSIGLALGPDSPPTMSQLIPDKSIFPRGANSGSAEINLILAGVFFRDSSRYTYSEDSIVTPNQIFGVQETRGAISDKRSFC